MLSIQKHSFFWALLTRRPCAALALAANLKSSAKRIIEIATKGERGPERLCNGALKGIQKSVPGSEKPYCASDWISGLGLKRTLMAQNDPYYGKLFPSPAAAFAQASRRTVQ